MPRSRRWPRPARAATHARARRAAPPAPRRRRRASTSAGTATRSSSRKFSGGNTGRDTLGLPRRTGLCTVRSTGSSQATIGFHCATSTCACASGRSKMVNPLDTAHVRLRLAQDADERQLDSARPRLEHLGALGARVEAHADRGDLAAAAGDARQRRHLGEAFGGGLAVEDRVAHWHHDDVGEGDDARQVEAAQASGRVENDVGDTCGRPRTRLDPPPSRRSARFSAGRGSCASAATTGWIADGRRRRA